MFELHEIEKLRVVVVTMIDLTLLHLRLDKTKQS
jgi:hypothetical protein